MRNAAFALVALILSAPGGVRAETTPSAAEYVQSGLVMHLDGIENVGTGLAHDSAATAWKDLSGNGFDWTLGSGNSSWDALGLHMLGKGTCGTLATRSASDFSGKLRTIEFVYRNEAGNTSTMIFVPACGLWYLYTQSGRIAFGGSDKTTPNSYAGAGSTTNSYHVTYASGSSYAGVSTLYVNGENAGLVAAGDYWGVGSAACLGNRNSGGSLFAKGILMALRVYDRELTQSEIMANARLDARRFGTPVPATRFRLAVEATDGGTVSADGETFAAAVTNDVDFGESVTVSARDPDGAAFLLWEEASVAPVASGAAKRTMTFAMPANDVVLKARFNPSSGGCDARLSRYAAAGMIGWWDGISNAGLAQPHDSSAAVWKSLLSGFDLTLNASYAAFETNALYCTGGTRNAAGAAALNGIYTIEIAMGPPGSGTECVLFSGYTSRMVATYSSLRIMGATGGRCFYTAGVPATYTFTYGGSGGGISFYEDGVQKSDYSGSDSWSSVPNVFTIGAQNASYGLKRRIYAIRCYGRVLADAEIASNARADGVRFFGKRDADEVLLTTVGGGKARIDDGEAAGSQPIETAAGEEMTLTAVPDAGKAFVGWKVDGMTLSGADVTANPLVLTNNVLIGGIVAAFADAGSAEASVSAYARDGLIGQWDGIVNAGLGFGHDSGTNVWADLAGSHALALTGKGAFSENALRCTGPAASHSTGVAAVRSCEIVCDIPTSGSRVLMLNGSDMLISTYAKSVLCGFSGVKTSISTNLATYAWVYRTERGWTLYENGAERLEVVGTDSWGGGSGLWLGGRSAGEGYAYSGRVFAMRFYDRALTPAEIAHNSDLDQKRFFGCDDVGTDRGVRKTSDGAYEYRLRVTSAQGGDVSVNGRRLHAGDVWLPAESAVTITALPCGAYDFSYWADDACAAIRSADVTAPTVTFALARAAEIGCHFRRIRILARGSARDYARDGLVAQWDGIENVAYGAPHSATTNVWTELLGSGRDWDLALSNGAWTATGLRFGGKGVVGTIATNVAMIAAADAKTLEVVYAQTKTGQSIVLAGFCTDGNRQFYTSSDARVGYYSSNNGIYGNAATVGATNTCSVFYNDYGLSAFSSHVNGALMLNAWMNTWWEASKQPSLGGRVGWSPSLPANGELMAIRVYNRRLSSAERLANAKLDRVRFGGEGVPGLPGLSVSVR